MWETIRDSAEIEWLRNDADRRLIQLQALEQMDNLQVAVDRAAERGLLPLTWPVLARAGAVPGVPVDPGGTPYEIDASGRVQLSANSTLFPLPREPQRLMPL